MPIRLRVAAIFVAALALAFALGSWLLVSQLSSVMLRYADNGLALQLSHASQLLGSSGSATSGTSQDNLAYGDYIVQLVDASGRVRQSSSEAGSAPLLTPAEQDAARRGRITVSKTIDGDAERLMGEPLADRQGWIAVAGVSLESANGTISAVVTRLVIGGIVFLVIFGAGAYLLARASLAPVERLRRKAAALSDRDPAARLPVPRTRDEVSALARTMNDLLTRLHNALARQRSLVADASHELRTPLAVLRGELELAAKPGRTRDELAEAIASAADEATRLSRVTDDLLLLARSDEDQLDILAEAADIGDLIGRSAERARQRCAAAGVSCAIAVPPGLTAVVDSGRISQAVDNLVDNAVRYAPAGSEIGLAAWVAARWLVIEVTDAGPGFPAEYLPHAFERFRRPDGVRRRADGGAGLGLAIVQAVAHAHGGRATVSNRQPRGAAVRIEIPAS